MTLTKDQVRIMIIDHLNKSNSMDLCQLIAEFIENEKICPKLVIDIVTQLADDNIKLDDGRTMQRVSQRIPIDLSERFWSELEAHQTFHTGGIRCPKV